MTAVCAIIKNEQRYILEWAKHHIRIGFDRIYLFEDTGSESHADLLGDPINSGRVVLQSIEDCVPAETGFRQMDLYIWFLRKYRSETDWCAFIDADEFIMLNNGAALREITERYGQYPGVALYWKIYNAGGHVNRPCLPLMKAYTQSVEWWRKCWDFKSFVNLNLCERWVNNHMHLERST